MIDLVLNAGFKPSSVLRGRPFVEPGIYSPRSTSPCYWIDRDGSVAWRAAEASQTFTTPAAAGGFVERTTGGDWRSSLPSTDWRQKKGCS